MKWSVGTKIGSGFALALAIIVHIGALTKTAGWVDHTHKVLERLAALLQGLIDAETGQRGYIITGEDTYLEPYQAALGVIEQDVKELRELTKDNPNQQRRLDLLQPMLNERISSLKAGMAARRDKGLEGRS